MNLNIDAHRGVRWGEDKYSTPSGKFQNTCFKNAIKPKIGGPPRQFFMKALTPPPPPWDFGKIIKYPLPWIFNPCVSMITFN